jgi:hypothetical protein
MLRLTWVLYGWCTKQTAPSFPSLADLPDRNAGSSELLWGVKAYRGDYIEIPVNLNFVRAGWAKLHTLDSFITDMDRRSFNGNISILRFSIVNFRRFRYNTEVYRFHLDSINKVMDAAFQAKKSGNEGKMLYALAGRPDCRAQLSPESRKRSLTQMRFTS